MTELYTITFSTHLTPYGSLRDDIEIQTQRGNEWLLTQVLGGNLIRPPHPTPQKYIYILITLRDFIAKKYKLKYKDITIHE